jgi:hypothetical protein
VGQAVRLSIGTKGGGARRGCSVQLSRLGPVASAAFKLGSGLQKPATTGPMLARAYSSDEYPQAKSRSGRLTACGPMCSDFSLENFSQFGCESALGFVIALPASATIGPGTLLRFRSRSRHRARGATLWRGGSLGRLRRVCTKNLIFEGGSVETPDNGLHFVRCGCFHESESLGFLRFVIPDDLNRIRDKVFGGEPLFNVVGRDPSG